MAYRIDNASKGMWQRINEMFAAWVPRQAVVTRSESGGVWVRFAPVDPTAPESWFPSTIANPAAGTGGWVFTLGGKKGLFIATGVVRETTLTQSLGSNTPTSTTVITTAYTDFVVLSRSFLATIFPQITEGLWDVSVNVSVLVYRSVSTGGIYLGVGSETTGQVALGRNFPQTGGYTLTKDWVGSNLSPTSLIDIRYAGFSTAGTTNCVSFSALVTATRRA